MWIPVGRNMTEIDRAIEKAKAADYDRYMEKLK